MRTPYQLHVDGFADDHFRVHSFRGKETLSEAWSFDLVVTAEAGDVVEQAALGQRAVLLFNVAGEQRAFYGVVAAVRLTQAHRATDWGGRGAGVGGLFTGGGISPDPPQQKPYPARE